MDKFLDHAVSDGHKDAVNIHRVKKATPVEKAGLPVAQILQSLNTKNINQTTQNAH